MSKGSQFWGNASGKLGEQVLYRAGGEQRSRTYVAKIKNPKTLAQMENRILMNNVVSMFRAYKPVLSVSFPNKKSNQSGFNAFVQANKNSVRYGIPKEDVSLGFFMPFDVKASAGDISIDTSASHEQGRNITDPGASGQYGFVLNGLMPGTVVLEGQPSDAGPGYLTPDIIYKIMTANGNPLGLPGTFKITVLGGFYDLGYTENSGADALYSAAWVQYVCSSDPDKCKMTTFGNPDNIRALRLGTITAGYEVEENPDGANTYKNTYENLAAGISPDEAAGNDLSFCVIVSWTENGKQRVTTSRFIGGSGVRQIAALYRPGGEVYQQVLDNYGYTQESSLATK